MNDTKWLMWGFFGMGFTVFFALSFPDYAGFILIFGLILSTLPLIYILILDKNRVPEDSEESSAIISIIGQNQPQKQGFEHNGTFFETNTELIPILMYPGKGMPEAEFSVRFVLPDLKEKFLIQHETFFSKGAIDCEQIYPPGMPENFIFHSLNPRFLLSLLENEKIREEIHNYPADGTNRLTLIFENKMFNIIWKMKRVERELLSISNFEIEQISQTAIVFHDELVKLTEKSRGKLAEF